MKLDPVLNTVQYSRHRRLKIFGFDLIILCWRWEGGIFSFVRHKPIIRKRSKQFYKPPSLTLSIHSLWTAAFSSNLLEQFEK